MITRLALGVVWAVTMLPAFPAEATHYKLFILTGQSNSLGTTNAGEADPSSGTDPADVHIKFAWNNVMDERATIGDSGEIFTSLQDQQGGVYPGSATHWGPEMAFGRTLYRAGVRNFGIIKISRGGGGNTCWSKADRGHMYSLIVKTVGRACAALKSAGHTFEIVGLLYLQGESDSPVEASLAKTRLEALVDNLRADLPNASALHAVVAGIAAAGDTRNVVRTNQKAAADGSPRIDFFSNLDLQAKVAAADRLAVHFNKAAKNTIGERFAQAFFDAGIIKRHYGRLVFIGDSITQGGNGDHASYRHTVFRHLAQRGVPKDPETGYVFVGSVTGAYMNSSITAPAVNGQTFDNVHDGHFGWRASWECGRVPLPAGRYNTNNLRRGTLMNWIGLSKTYKTDDAGELPYPGQPYTPDTAVLLIGINDLAGGAPPSQVRDDVGTMIDQLRTSNPEIRIFLIPLLPTGQGAERNQQVAEFNRLLPALAASKNVATSGSPLWLVDAGAGFNPNTLTYDKLHPNAQGEAYVGDRITAGLGLIPTPDPGAMPPPPPPPPTVAFRGNEIWNGTAYVAGWKESAAFTKSLTDKKELRLVNPGGSEILLDGTNVGWSALNGQSWQVEIRVKFNENPNGFALWMGTGKQRIVVEIYADRTQDIGGESFHVSHNNMDGAFHTFRVIHDAEKAKYHVWRDGVRLSPADGANYDMAWQDNRLLFGDYSTRGTFGDRFDAVIESVRLGPVAGPVKP